MDYLDLHPMSACKGHIVLPGSKSMSNRVLLLAALAQGETEVRNVLRSEDTQVMLLALEKLGVHIQELSAPDHLLIQGVGGVFPVKHAEFFLGNAGTAVRSLTAVLSVMSGEYVLRGVPRMHERPIGDLLVALRQVGAQITCTQNEGFLPLTIHPVQQGAVHRVIVRGDVSSQYLTGLLMAAPLLSADVEMIVEGELISKSYIDLTLAVMQRFGVSVENDHGYQRFFIRVGSAYQASSYYWIEGDASSASYFLAAGVLGGGPLRIDGIGKTTLQGDIRFIDEMIHLGADVKLENDHVIVGRLDCTQRLPAFSGDYNHIPDAAMTLAVLALFADGPCLLRNIGSWRVKETDRIEAMANELRKLGAIVQVGPDSLAITPPIQVIPNVAIETYDDHRMAMSFSLVSLAGVPVRILDPGCTAKTFPHYFEQLSQLRVLKVD